MSKSSVNAWLFAIVFIINENKLVTSVPTNVSETNEKVESFANSLDDSDFLYNSANTENSVRSFYKENSTYKTIDDPYLGVEIIEVLSQKRTANKFAVNIINTTTDKVIESINCTDSTNLDKYNDPELEVDVVWFGDDIITATVPKCCPIGQRYIEDDGTQKCLNTIATFEPLVYFKCGFTILSVDMNLKVEPKDPCRKGKYMLEPEEDFYLMYDGSLHVKSTDQDTMIVHQNDAYCMESFEAHDKNNQTITRTIPLICFDEDFREAGSKITLTLYAIAMLISVPFLLATLFIYTVIKELRTVHGKALACHVSCLAVAFFCLACVQLASKELSLPVCVGVAFVIQVSFVACFFWLNVMCIETYLNVKKHVSQDPTYRDNIRRFNIYCAYAWGFPLLLLVISMFMDFVPIVPSSFVKPKFGKSACWFQTDSASFPYFYLPVGCLILVNIILFILTSSELTKNSEIDYDRLDQKLEAHIKLKRFKRIFRMCIVLFLVMGINWVMEVISWAVGGTLLVWSVFDIFNALQGVIIFGIFVLQKNDRVMIWKELKLKYRNHFNSQSSNQSEMTTLNNS